MEVEASVLRAQKYLQDARRYIVQGQPFPFQPVFQAAHPEDSPVPVGHRAAVRTGSEGIQFRERK
jgi:hypothetical protein